MSCCNKHHHKSKQRRRGVIYRVTNGIAQQFGFKRKWVLAGFIVGLVIHAPLTIFVFLAAMFFLEHPDKAEPIKQKVVDYFSSSKSSFKHGPQTASATPGMDLDDIDFSELRREFDELEQRTGNIERHVTSDEFELNQEFNRMKDKKD